MTEHEGWHFAYQARRNTNGFGWTQVYPVPVKPKGIRLDVHYFIAHRTQAELIKDAVQILVTLGMGGTIAAKYIHHDKTYPVPYWMNLYAAIPISGVSE